MAMLLYWKRTLDVSVSWFPKRAVFGLTVFCALTIALIALLVLKLLDLACSPRRTILKRVNIRHSYVNVEESEDSAQPAGSWKYGGGALFGRKPWQEKLPCVSSEFHLLTKTYDATRNPEVKRDGYATCAGLQHLSSSSYSYSTARTRQF